MAFVFPATNMTLAPKTPDPVSTIEIIFPADINHHGTLFGGQLMSWMDKVAYYAAFRHGNKPAVTASVESLDFGIAPHIGDLLDFVGKVIYTGTSSMVIRVDVFRTDVGKKNERRMCNSGFFTFVAVDEQGHPQPIPPLLVETEEDRLNWAKGEEIKQAAAKRRQR